MNTPRPVAPTLLLGATGFLGPALRDALGAATASTHFAHPAPGSVFFDASSTPVADVVAAAPAQPSCAVILLGITNIDACARDPVGTAQVNVYGVIRVIDELRALGVPPVFVSSDAVFDGTRADWREDDEPRPILTYGRQKLAVERHLRSLPPPWLIVRLPKLLAVGRDPRCMLTQWVDALGRCEPIRCATDQYFTPAAAVDAAAAIARLVRERAQGVFHLGGPRRISRRELLALVEREYGERGRSHATVVDCSLRDIAFAEARPLDTSLCSEKFAAACGMRFRGVDEIAQAAVRDCLDRRAEGA